MILNLKKFNKPIKYRPFEIDNIQTVLSITTPGRYIPYQYTKNAYCNCKNVDIFSPNYTPGSGILGFVIHERIYRSYNQFAFSIILYLSEGKHFCENTLSKKDHEEYLLK